MGTPGSPPVANSLAVNREQFLDALRQIKKLTGLSGQSAVFTFEQHQLRMDLGGCSFKAEAEGTWHGQVAVSVGFVQGLAKVPPFGKGPITISCDGDFLQVGPLKVKCKWDRLNYPRITLPLGASLLEILSLRAHYSEDDIRNSGLDNVVAKAESEATRVIEKAMTFVGGASKLIDKAAATLRPLGFTEDDLQQVCEEPRQVLHGLRRVFEEKLAQIQHRFGP